MLKRIREKLKDARINKRAKDLQDRAEIARARGDKDKARALVRQAIELREARLRELKADLNKLQAKDSNQRAFKSSEQS